MTALGVWRDGRRLGVLDTARNGDVRFTYDANLVRAAAEEGNACDVGFTCPARAEPYTGPTVEAVFENLLPEGTLRDALGMVTKHAVTDVVGLLGAVGGECAGALQLWPDGEGPPGTAAYDEFSPDAVHGAFAATEWQLRQVTGRASLSGAQQKLALWRRPPAGSDAPQYRLPRDGAPTTVVVKRPGAAFPHLLEAELVGMRLMEAAGVPTASSTRCHVLPACHESVRFDRVMRDDGSVTRLHAEDGCQLTGKLSKHKYAGTGGPTFAQLCAVLNRRSSDPLTDRQTLFRWAAANAAMGNYDGHAKNVSVVYGPNGMRLAPAYDVVVTAVYGTLDKEFALHFGGTVHPQALQPASLLSAAREFSLSRELARELAADVVHRVRAHVNTAAHDASALGGDERALAALTESVQQTASELQARLGL